MRPLSIALLALAITGFETTSGTDVMVGLATVPNAETLAIGTFRPGLGVTLYTE
ncbi:hypothetical protein [Archangium violaceum]|uniref:hypothetical protein n=1 Tax=Archangium violaceum TaxID=83451 RepID=UPI0013639638|nr:hypothetical protein [Archangium violaceum]